MRFTTLCGGLWPDCIEQFFFRGNFLQISPISETKARPQHRELRALLFANFVFLKYKTVSLKLCLDILVCLSENSTVAGTCICAKDLLATTTKLERKIKKGNILYNVIPDPGKFPVVDSKLEHTVENNHFFAKERYNSSAMPNAGIHRT